jgi:uncharacterized small protein (DUF1192 family)
MIDFLKLAKELDNNPEPGAHQDGLNLMAADALRQAHSLQEAYTNLGSERDNLLLECDGLRGEIARLRSENERLKGKVVSPEVTTMCFCEDCGAATRASRHLDMDCDTIAKQRNEIARLKALKESK